MLWEKNYQQGNFGKYILDLSFTLCFSDHVSSWPLTFSSLAIFSILIFLVVTAAHSDVLLRIRLDWNLLQLLQSFLATIQDIPYRNSIQDTFICRLGQRFSNMAECFRKHCDPIFASTPIKQAIYVIIF